MATKKKTNKKGSSKPARPAPKTVAKKPLPKKPVSKKPLAKKAAHKPVKKVAPKPVKKASPKKPVKAAPVKAKAIKAKPAKTKVTPKASPAKKAVTQVKAPPVPKKPFLPPPPPPPSARKVKPARTFNKAELAAFRVQLLKQLNFIQANLDALAGDNLKRSPIESSGDISAHSTHMADQGTDNFDRELALNLASGRQESLYDIEDAIQRIDEKTYGACEICGGGIELPRLKALPFAKKCMVCQNAAERGRTKYRPFGGTMPTQQLEAQDLADSTDATD